MSDPYSPGPDPKPGSEGSSGGSSSASGNGYGQDAYGQNSYDQNSYDQNSYGQSAPQSDSTGTTPYGAPSAAGTTSTPYSTMPGAGVDTAERERIKKNALIAMIVGFVCGGLLPGIFGLLGYLKADTEPETARKFTKWAWIVFIIMWVLMILLYGGIFVLSMVAASQGYSS